MRIFFDEVIVQYRLVSDIYNKTEDYQLVGNIEGSIRPINANDVILIDGIPSETFKFYCNSDVDIKEGDKLVYAYQDYIVKYLRRYELKDISRIECYLTITRQ